MRHSSIIIMVIVAVLGFIGTGAQLRGDIVIENYGAASFTKAGDGTWSSTGKYDPVNNYTMAGIPWVAYLDPSGPFPLASAPKAGSPFVRFLPELEAEFPTWSFSFAGDLEDNSLVVKAYDVEASPPVNATYVGIQQDLSTSTFGFYVQYVPTGNDPTANVHWIQVIYDNHAIDGGHGDIENIVDNGGADNPFYDTKGAADDRNFVDAPGRLDPGNSHVWIADLYLVTVPDPTNAPTVVNIYDGIEWGWRNDPIPEPATVIIWSLLGGIGIAVAHSRRRNAA